MNTLHHYLTHITIDTELRHMLEQVIELEQQLQQLPEDSNRWYAINDEVQGLYYDIAVSVIYEYRHGQ